MAQYQDYLAPYKNSCIRKFSGTIKMSDTIRVPRTLYQMSDGLHVSFQSIIFRVEELRENDKTYYKPIKCVSIHNSKSINILGKHIEKRLDDVDPVDYTEYVSDTGFMVLTKTSGIPTEVMDLDNCRVYSI